MKKELTIRFLICNLVIIYMSVVIYIIINLIVFGGNLPLGQGLFNTSFNIESFSEDTLKNIDFYNNKFQITDELATKLNDNNIWLQILDSTNREVFSKNKPDDIPMYYLAGDLVEYTVDPLKSSFPATLSVKTLNIGDYSYTVLLGFPINEVFQYKFTFTNSSLKIEILIIFTVLILMVIIAFLISRLLSGPIVRLVKDIGLLKQGRYFNGNSNDGIFKEVNRDISELSSIINEAKNHKEVKSDIGDGDIK